MLANLLHTTRARLFPPHKSATFSCIRCGLRVHISGAPDYVRKKILATSENHPRLCKPTLYTRTEAEQAAFERLRLYINLDHDNDRRFVTEAFLAFLDNPDSPYPYKSHTPDDEEDDGDGQPELSPAETGERENSLLYWLGPRTDTAPRAQEDNQ